MKKKLYYFLLILLVALSILPFYLFRFYISITGNIDARWYALLLFPLQVIIWINLLITIIYGVVYLIRQNNKNTHLD